MKVPTRHEVKKAYFVALRDAWFLWNTERLATVEANLRAVGSTQADIDAMFYYRFSYFRKRVERVVPPPSVHYWRVRKVFETFGSMVDSSSGMPLFNKAAWQKADNVHVEILAGFAADPPGVPFYFYHMDAKGEPKLDALGNPLLDCSRGSNDTECAHKQIIATFGTWSAGVRMTDALLREWRHRYNQGVSERRRLGFPKLGHYDTWLVDSLQLLVEANPRRSPALPRLV